MIQPEGWPRPRGYANAISGRGEIVALAGQVGWNPVTQQFETDDFVGQVEQALRNIITVLSAVGAHPEDVIRLTWYITSRNAYTDNTKRLGEVYRALFGTHYPAMTLVVVAGLVEERARVEIEATAVMAGTF
ncbi:MAG TPA: RidA family protein [Longimicrobiales bacterium]|nr:RidA family protein [Longimicrobiales bacterium]